MVVYFPRLFLSFGLSVLIGGLAYRRGSLTKSGWLGAVVVGTATAGLGGWVWGVLVVVFFVTSSALSHWRDAAKARVANDKFSKGHRRDFAQVMANGGVISGLAVLFACIPHPAIFAAALGALATITADTWATEVGTLSHHQPRLVTTGRPVSPGTSGGITVLGSLATLAGALLIALAAAVMLGLQAQPIGSVLLTTTLGGVVGAFSDSALGATVQRKNKCPRCQSMTEQHIHRCGTPTRQIGGWRWLNNDWVNFISSLIGAATSGLL
jgi:uncharacterized protein (TIGR00297 family)